MSFVIDASVLLAWLFEEEASATIEPLIVTARKSPPMAPTILYYELANILALAERRGRIDGPRAGEFLAIIEDLAIQIDTAHATSPEVLLSTSRETGLTAYDASYLELAKRLDCPLASIDRQLRSAAAGVGIPILPA